MHQVAEQPVQTALAVELVEEQSHHVACLFVGVEGQSAAGHAYVANGRMVEQLAPAGLVQPPLVQPPTQEVQLGLAHDPL